MLKRISEVLKEIGSPICLQKGQILDSGQFPSGELHFRSLDLNAPQVAAIAACLKEETDNPISSLSFSYNPMGDKGAAALAQHMPLSIQELGLVACQIGDVGGNEILKWMEDAPNLKMVCIEQNHLSADLKGAFEDFRKRNPQTLVIY